jgi:hypothetical protein
LPTREDSALPCGSFPKNHSTAHAADSSNDITAWTDAREDRSRDSR